jgi:hypothetical protein
MDFMSSFLALSIVSLRQPSHAGRRPKLLGRRADFPAQTPALWAQAPFNGASSRFMKD